MLRAIIIEDEEQKRSTLLQMVTTMRNDVEIVGEAADVSSGKQMILKNNPDLVFLDIQLPDGTGFDLLEQLGNINFKIIFITAYSEYAVKAFKFSAVDYILKPVSASDLMEAIDKAVQMLIAEYNLKLSTLLDNHRTISNDEKRIILKTIDKVHVIKIKDIIRCESDASYCHFFLTNGKKITASKPLKEFAGLFNDYGFFRVHKSHLVNIRLVQRYDRTEGGYVIMESGEKVPVSSYKREELIEFLETL
jgi:two-component system LytT family response regulator